MTSQGRGAEKTEPVHIDGRKSNKMVTVHVRFLDDTINTVQIQYKTTGRILFEQVCKMLNLLEVDYFGLEYVDDAGIKYWLDYEKPMCRQVGLSMADPLFYFCVKFYTPDPAQLEEEYTRYLYSLQIKHDLARGILQCNDNTSALMASYIVQAECGDYSADDYPDHGYLSSYKFVPHQDSDLEHKIMDNHKKHVGQTPSEADLNLLETVRRCELYGIRMTPAKDSEGVPLNLSIAHMGVLVFQNLTKINTFSWAKIRKLSFRRKKFLIKLHPEGYGYYKDTVEFVFESRNECKNFWKSCIENHAFFRCAEVKANRTRHKTRIFSRGSSFRYSGRTQKQIVEFVRDNYVKRQPFQRSTSLRLPSTSRSSVTQHVSAQPVSSSQSCGSVVLSSGHAAFASSEAASEFIPDPGPVSVSQPASPTTTVDRVANGGICGERQQTRPSSPPSGVSLVVESSSYGSRNGHDTLRIETTSLSARGGMSSDSETLYSPTSPSRNNNNNNNWDNDSSVPASPRSDGGGRRKRVPMERSYFIAKELLMTERMYKKDLELVNVLFRDEVSKEENMPNEPLSLLFHLVDPMYEFHCNFLRALEQRLAAWEGHGANPFDHLPVNGIGDVVLENESMVELYDSYIEKLPMVLERISNTYKYNSHFAQVYRDFEMQKMCYLPLTAFLLRPCHRLQHYCLLLQTLVDDYSETHPDYKHCQAALLKLQRRIGVHGTAISSLENFVKLMELQRDLTGLDNLIVPGREFLREGCLQKLSRKGYQQRMFFLFNDVLLYTSRASTPQLQFKVHGQLPLNGVMAETTEPKMGVHYCFTIYGGNRALMVAASCEEERTKWLEDLTLIRDPDGNDDHFLHIGLQSCSSSDEVLDTLESHPTTPKSPLRGGGEVSAASGVTPSLASLPSQEKHSHQHRSNTTVHVCWHRNTSVGKLDYRMATMNYLSGYLLRKFKNSSGWQKLWVVFTNFCLFFYKSFQDDFPLASLPLLGYSVGKPADQDSIRKDFVFKLQFKNHIYFFRAESEYTFSRWMEVISSATLHL